MKRKGKQKHHREHHREQKPSGPQPSVFAAASDIIAAQRGVFLGQVSYLQWPDVRRQLTASGARWLSVALTPPPLTLIYGVVADQPIPGCQDQPWHDTRSADADQSTGQGVGAILGLLAMAVQDRLDASPEWCEVPEQAEQTQQQTTPGGEGAGATDGQGRDGSSVTFPEEPETLIPFPPGRIIH